MGFYIKQICKRRPCALEICPTGCDEEGYKSMDVLRRLYQWRAVGARLSSKNKYFLAPILSLTLYLNCKEYNTNLGKKICCFHLFLYIFEINSEQPQFIQQLSTLWLGLKEGICPIGNGQMLLSENYYFSRIGDFRGSNLWVKAYPNPQSPI